MIYDRSNVPPTPSTWVYDVDRMERLEWVLSLDSGSGEVVCAHKPLQCLDGKVLTYKLKFRSVYPIYAGEHWPILFHCYGRIDQ